MTEVILIGAGALVTIALLEHASLRGYQKGSQALEDIIDKTTLKKEPETATTKIRKRDGTYYTMANYAAIQRNKVREDVKGLF